MILVRAYTVSAAKKFELSWKRVKYIIYFDHPQAYYMQNLGAIGHVWK